MTDIIYSKHSIDPKRLSRDYFNDPLKITKNGVGNEKPTKDDLIYLYIECNLSYDELKGLFDWGRTRIKGWNKFHKITKPVDLIISNGRKTCLERYGVENYSKTSEYNLKTKKTKLKKYGSENYNNIEKLKQTIKNRTQQQWETIQQKSKETNLKRYGRTNVGQFGTEEHARAIKEKYGRTNVGQFGTEEHNRAIKEKYGQDNYAKTFEFQNLYKNNEWVKNLQQKIYKTKKKNNSFNKSKPEDKYYNQLVEKYGEDNVVRQFKSKLYPFNCDFYIPSKDLYIEYNGHWGHHTEPYDPSNKEHQIILENWKQKEKESERVESDKKSYYTYAIEVWTIRDPLKRETAQKNGLNFIEIW